MPNSTSVRVPIVVPLIALSGLMAMLFFISPSSVWTLIVSLPFLLFLPGYFLMGALAGNKGLDRIETAVGSVVLSCAIAFAAYAGITFVLENVTLKWAYMGSLVMTWASLALLVVRSRKADGEKGTGLALNIPRPSGMGKRDRWMMIITIALVAMLVVSGALILSSSQREEFTEFYLLGEDGTAYNLPHNFTTSHSQNVTLGIVNHEGRSIDYSIEIWLVNYTNVNLNVTVYEMYFIGSFNVTLDSITLNVNEAYLKQYERLVPLNLTKAGNLSVLFFLYKGDSTYLPEYPLVIGKDYSRTIASNKMLQVANRGVQYLQLKVNIQLSLSPLYIGGMDGISSPLPQSFVNGVPQNISYSLRNREGVNTTYYLEFWAVNYTNIDMAVSVKEIYLMGVVDVWLPYTGWTNTTDSHYDGNFTLRMNWTGSYSVFAILYKNTEDAMPENPMIEGKNYAFTEASWRIVLCVRNQVQYITWDTMVAA